MDMERRKTLNLGKLRIFIVKLSKTLPTYASDIILTAWFPIGTT